MFYIVFRIYLKLHRYESSLPIPLEPVKVNKIYSKKALLTFNPHVDNAETNNLFLSIFNHLLF